MSEETIGKLAARFIEEMADHDGSLIAPDFKWWMSFRPETMTFEEFVEHVSHINLPPLQKEILGVVEGPDSVAVEVQGRCPLPDGRHYDNNYCFILKFRDRKIIEVREYCDTKLAADMFGGLGVPAQAA